MNNKKIMDYLDYLVPNPHCELNYNKDYEFLIAVMLSAQTKDSRVNIVTKELFSKYNNLKALKTANINDIEDIIRSIGNYHKKGTGIIEISKILDEKYNGIVPNNRQYLEELPMVGRKTTSLVLSVLYNEPNMPVDTHINRISKKLNIAEEKDDVLKVEQKLKKFFPKDSWNKLHHQLVLFGRYYCTAINPKCETCKLKDICNYNKNK